ncbi:hypothetical protein L6164_003566 [Bauhinia variegata]|uniref:Uncharacterized protein n=1 Tax=Bauhinia variegata TaxID=167791 RepID=A0ACB9Q298_BAUVA|nr:hypothetical protein L6164_003566 [Bauhinia variegata]
MADSSPFTESHFTFSELSSPNRRKPIKQGRCFPNVLFKSIFVAIFIIVLPLFPSQAPEFINQTIFTKFWELFHLLFVGIAVAYGLFSRRNVGSDIETHPSVDNTPEYVSKFFPVSTNFGDGYENSCGSYEKTMMHCWNSQYFEGESGVVPAARDEQYQPQLPISGGSFRDSFEYDGANVVQAWNSEYYHSEPVVVVAQPYYTVDGCGEIVGYKPLGLPVRSLRSTAVELDSPRYANESDSSSGSKGPSKTANREFDDLGPSNMEQQFSNHARLSSPIPWNSRSRRVESEERHGNVTLPSNFRPLSVDEATFASLSSHSLQSTASFSSQMSLYSSVDSVMSENRNFQQEDVGKEKTFYGSSLENMNFQEEDMGKKETSHGYSSENMNLQEQDMGENEISYGYSPENLEFREEVMGRKKRSHGSSSEMNFHEGDFGKTKTSRQSLPRSGRIASKEDIGKKETSYGYSSENENLEEKDMGENELSYGYSPEHMNLREQVTGKKKSSYGSSSQMNFHEGDLGKKNTSCQCLPRPGRIASKEDMGKKETSYGYSSENMKLQEEDLGENEISYGYSPENMNFGEEVIGKKTSSNGCSSEMNFLEGDLGKKKTSGQYLLRPGRIANKEDMGKKETSYEYSSENTKLQVEDMGGNEISYGYSPENMNSRDEVIGKKKSSNGSPSEMNFHGVDVRKKKTSRRLPRSGRIANEEKNGTVNRPSHFRPQSVDDIQSESLNSWSLQPAAASLSSGVSLYSSLESVSSENRNLQKEELGEKKSSHSSSSSTSSPPARINGETTRQAFHSRGYSIGSLLQHDMRRNLKDDLGEKKSSHGSSSSSSSSPSPPARVNAETSVQAFHSRGYSIGSFQHDMKTNLKDDLRGLNGMIRDEDSLRSIESGMDSLQSDPERPPTLTKPPSKGKSVRTRRASGMTSETKKTGEVFNKQTGKKMEKVSDNEGAVLMRKDKMKSGVSDQPLKGTSTKNLDTPSPKLETTFSSIQKREKHEPSKSVQKEDLDIDLENIQLSSDDDVMSEIVNDSGLDSEVDKKASEFIAKFKAQIRLQKMASVEISRGPRTGGNHIR